MPSSRGSSRPKDRTHISCIFYRWATGYVDIHIPELGGKVGKSVRAPQEEDALNSYWMQREGHEYILEGSYIWPFSKKEA